jgi:exosortase/archaeosortase family protein
MLKTINQYFDFKFYLRFALMFASLYYAYIAFIGIITPGGSYSPFVVENLNVVVLLRSTILYGAHLITELLGVSTVVTYDSITDPESIISVQMDWPCYGVINMSFWFAYVLAKSLPLRIKLTWAFSGLALIWFLNCLRIAFLAISIKKQWSSVSFLLNTNNHDLFNYFLYVVIFGLILLFERRISLFHEKCPK